MARIYKESRYVLQLLIGKSYGAQYEDVKIFFYTKNPSNQVMAGDEITIKGNIAEVKIGSALFDNLEDGLIKYIVYGTKDGIPFIEERQSNYFLKTPLDFKPSEKPDEDITCNLIKESFSIKGDYEQFTASDYGADGFESVAIDAYDYGKQKFNEGYEEGKNQGGTVTTYPTIRDTYNTEDVTTEVNFKGTVAVCLQGGSSYYMVVTDHTGAFYVSATQPYDVGDECVFTGVVKRNSGTYIKYMNRPTIEVLSKGNYVVMPTDAVEFTNINELYTPNEFGYTEMKYLYIQGEIQSIGASGNITIVSAGGQISLRYVKEEWRSNLVVGDYVRAYMFTTYFDSSFIPTDIIKLGTEGGDCNIQEYKWVRPSMADRAENGDIYIYPDEGFDAVGYIDLDPNDIYNEGYNEGKIAGKAEGGDLNIGEGYIGLTENERGQTFELIPSNDGYDAYSKVTVELHNFDLGGDTNIYDALSVNQLLMDGNISYDNVYIFKGEITEIQRIRPEYGDARYTLDGSLNVYNGQTMGYDLQVGDNVIVYGTLSEYNGAPQFSAGSEIKAWWREGGSGNCDDAYNSGYNQGYNDGQANCGGGSANLINPIIFSETEGNTINAESVEIPTFAYEGNQHYNVWALNMAEYEEFKIQIRFQPNNGGNEEPVNIFGCEDTDWDNTTFGARIYQGQIYFRMSGDDVEYPYNESAWYDVEMGYNSSKRWIIVNGETLLETDHAWFTKPSQNFMIGAINSGGNAFRPFYGRIAAAFIEANGSQVWLLPKEEGHMDVYWNDKSFPWVTLNGESNARFEAVWFGGDGMKSITWLGKRVSCPSAQEQVNEYYYCPLILGDSGFGEAAKSWDESMVALNDYDGNIIEDKLYVPTFGNRNEFRTKTKAKIVQTLYNVEAIGSIEFGSGVEFIALYSPSNFKNLTKLIIGEDMQTANFGTSTFPIIKEIWSYSTTSEIDVYFSLGSSFNGGGTLYLKNKDHETVWKQKLPSDWTIVYI